jgi:hypothetical protein
MTGSTRSYQSQNLQDVSLKNRQAAWFSGPIDSVQIIWLEERRVDLTRVLDPDTGRYDVTGPCVMLMSSDNEMNMGWSLRADSQPGYSGDLIQSSPNDGLSPITGDLNSHHLFRLVFPFETKSLSTRDLSRSSEYQTVNRVVWIRVECSFLFSLVYDADSLHSGIFMQKYSYEANSIIISSFYDDSIVNRSWQDRQFSMILFHANRPSVAKRLCISTLPRRTQAKTGKWTFDEIWSPRK